MGTDLAQHTNGNVPALYDPASSIDAEDIEFPRLFIAQGSHGFVQEELVRRGSLVLATSGSDPDPNILTLPGDKDGVKLHVLTLRKTKSLTDAEGNLQRFDFNDPDVPPEAWTVYHYLVALPGIEDDIPVKWILTKSGKPAAQKMNTVLARSAGTQPVFKSQFTLRTSERNDQARSYRWHVPVIVPSEPSDGDLVVAERLFTMAQGVNHQRVVENEPAI